MVSNRIIRPVIVICLLSATVMLGGCSPPLPKTWLPLAGDRMPPSSSSGQSVSR